MSLTPELRRQRARIAALTRWSQEDPAANAARGQQGLLRKFFDATDPALADAERWRRAEAARKAHMQRMAFEREKARRLADAASGEEVA